MSEQVFSIFTLSTGTALLLLSLGLPMWASAKGRVYRSGPFLAGLLASFVFISCSLLGLEKVQAALADIWGVVGLLAVVLTACLVLGLLSGGGSR